MTAEGKELWGESEKEYRSQQPVVYVACKKPKMKHAGYSILSRKADSLLSPLAMQKEAYMPMEYHGMKVEKLFKFRMFTFPGEENLKTEKNGTLWSPIFN